MFCSKCGYEINNGAIFCQQCGTKLKTDEGFATSLQCNNKNNELNREALKIYLGDVLTLECIKSRFEIRMNEINQEIENIQRNNYYQKFTIYDDNHYVHLLFDGEKYYVAYMDNGYGGVYLDQYLNTDRKYAHYFKWLPLDNDAYLLSSLSEWKYITDSYFLILLEESIAKKEFYKIFDYFKAQAPICYKENMSTINKLSEEYNGIIEELNKTKELLKKAYGINIIPDSFRNKLYAIYYLHNFINTSNESLTTALLHCDLDEIKSKLDEIIELQREMIIQQAVIAAQNQQMIQQNQMQLNLLSKIESNTNHAAQYAAIAANNAEACAWIGMANYIK